MLQTNRWRAVWKPPWPIRPADPTRDSLLKLIGGYIGRRERDLERFVRRLGKDAPVVHYEDICAAPDGFVFDMCRLLDLEPPPAIDTRVDFKVMRDDLSRAWADRFRDGA